MKIINNELVKFTLDDKKIKDFSGEENSLSVDERLEFLKEYQTEARKWYNDDKLDEKAVNDNEIDSFLEGYKTQNDYKIRRKIKFDKMDACTQYKAPEYINLHTYCGTYIENNEIIFPKRKIRPTPCAMYEFSGKKSLKVSMEVYISNEYKSSQGVRCSESQAGRVIELRSKTLDVAKIKICSTGEVISMSKDMWESVYDEIGNIKFGEYNDITIEVNETVSITLNGKTISNISLTYDSEIDNIFFDGGMFPRDTWKVRNLAINDEPVVFEKNDESDGLESAKKEVELPYAIGGYENRNKRLILTKEFDVEEFSEASLYIETLDPCGEVWINGERIFCTDTVTDNNICITDFLKSGKNSIKIIVEPRAGEIYYYWHRHTDCYNGWFCGKVEITFTNNTFIKNIKLKTTDIEPSVRGKAFVELNSDFCGEIKLYARKIYPDYGEPIPIGDGNINGISSEIQFNGKLMLWDCENPNLYEIKAELYNDNCLIDDFVVESGFRTIEQKNGEIYLNNNKILMNGALLMQFLPPLNEVPINHNCASLRQIAWQCLMLKKMNGNTLRLHILGYGTNDDSYAKVCNRLGIMLIWTTRFIDTLEDLAWDDGEWHEKKAYIDSLKMIVNHPSVVMYEGSNEYHPKNFGVINRMYNEFVSAIKEFDDSRLICPCSHLYYGGGIYEMGCVYYNDDGTLNQNGEKELAGFGWNDSLVIRSSHTYEILCGYGTTWETMRKQDWKWQDEMLCSKNHSYLITEFAVTALPNPNTDDAKSNKYVESYERNNEIGAIGRLFEQSEWKESQALQALCASQSVKHLRMMGVDGMLWCCLMSGANNGSYMKPPIDFYGYKKLGFYALRDAFRPVYACKADIDVAYDENDTITPVILGDITNKNVNLIVKIIDTDDNIIDEKVYENVKSNNNVKTLLEPFKPKWDKKGYYDIQFELCY